MSSPPDRDDQRLDKWLLHARVVKTRTLAAELVAKGHVRLNGRRQNNPAKKARGGDVLTIALAHKIRVLRVLAIAQRRGPFSEAQSLFEDLSDREQSSAPISLTAGYSLRLRGKGASTLR